MGIIHEDIMYVDIAIWHVALSNGVYPQMATFGKKTWHKLLDNSMDWFKGKSTENHGFYHEI